VKPQEKARLPGFFHLKALLLFTRFALPLPPEKQL